MRNETISATSKFLSLLKVKSTKEFLIDSFLSNPNYPSLLSISDTLTKYKINNLAIKSENKEIDKLPTPCIAQVDIESSTFFYVLAQSQNGTISYYDHANKLIQCSNEEFLSIWTGIALVVEKSENSKEPGIDKRIYKRIFLLTNIVLLKTFFLIWLLLTIKITVNLSFNFSIFAFTTFKVLGLTLTSLLLWYEHDRYNPTLQSFCSRGKRINCNSVLNSKYAKIFKGELSLSVIAFSYFFGTLFYFFLNSFSGESTSILAILSFLSLPIVVASIYYQAMVIKQWCKFCIGISIVLIGEIAIGYSYYFYQLPFDLSSLAGLFTLILLPIVVFKLLSPLLQKAKNLNLYKQSLSKIKHAPTVFEALLSKSSQIQTSTTGLGICIKNDGARYNIIKVCNPYCGPCSKAHPVLEELVGQGKINLQILFTAKPNDFKRSGRPVRHFMAIDEKFKDRQRIKEALDDWYYAKEKDYDKFAKKYPMNGELLYQTHKLEAMDNWCKK